MTEEMTSMERVLAAIELKETDHVPCSVSFGYHMARRIGMSIKDFLIDVDRATEMAHKTFDDLGGIDYPIVILGMGSNPVKGYSMMPVRMKMPGVELDDNDIPQSDEREVMPADGYDQLIEMGWNKYISEVLLPIAIPDPSKVGYKNLVPRKGTLETDYQYWATKKVFAFPANPMINLPFEMLSFVRSFEKFTVDLYRQPDKVLEASEALLPGFIADGLAQAKNTNLVSVAASRCASRFISPKMFQKFVLPYFKKIVSTFTEAGKIIYIHLDQDWLKSLPFFREFPEGKYIVHLDGMTDMFKAKEILGDRFCLMGDVPATLFKLGTTEEVEAYCKKLIDVVGKGSGLILAAGCQIPDNAKFENIQTMVNTAKNYRPHKR